jgi:hypothetical protein
MPDHRLSPRLLEIQALIESGDLRPDAVIRLNRELANFKAERIGDLLLLNRLRPRVYEQALKHEGALNAFRLISKITAFADEATQEAGQDASLTKVTAFSGPAFSTTKERITKPSKDDWAWYHILKRAGLIDGHKLKEDAASRDKAREYLVRKQIELPNTPWARECGGWRNCFLPSAWRNNSRQFFRNKVGKCIAWRKANPGEKPPKGKRVI